VLLLAIIAGLIWYFVKKRRKDEDEDKDKAKQSVRV
jgi:hypothetical protein